MSLCHYTHLSKMYIRSHLISALRLPRALQPPEPSTQALTHGSPHSPFWRLVGHALHSPCLLTPEHSLANCATEMPTPRILSIAQPRPPGCPPDVLSSTMNQARVLNCFSTKSAHTSQRYRKTHVYTKDKLKDDYSA